LGGTGWGTGLGETGAASRNGGCDSGRSSIGCRSQSLRNPNILFLMLRAEALMFLQRVFQHRNGASPVRWKPLVAYTTSLMTDFGLLAQSELFSGCFRAQEVCHDGPSGGGFRRWVAGIRRFPRPSSPVPACLRSVCLMTGLVVHNAAVQEPRQSKPEVCRPKMRLPSPANATSQAARQRNRER